MNHIHLLDFFNHGARIRRAPFFDPLHPDFIVAKALGRKICFIWAHKLRQEFPRWHFKVYFHAFDPIVRFHKVRKGEAAVIGDKDRKKEVESGDLLIVEPGN